MLPTRDPSQTTFNCRRDRSAPAARRSLAGCGSQLAKFFCWKLACAMPGITANCLSGFGSRSKNSEQVVEGRRCRRTRRA